MSVLLTKYNAIDLPSTEQISLTYQLNKRCKNLPEKVSLPYFIKVLDMQEQYREVINRDKQDKEDFKGFEFQKYKSALCEISMRAFPLYQYSLNKSCCSMQRISLGIIFVNLIFGRFPSPSLRSMIPCSVTDEKNLSSDFDII